MRNHGSLYLVLGELLALRFSYYSKVYELMRDGVSDMHCMSNAYLVEDLGVSFP